jgi:hypothetical protein
MKDQVSNEPFDFLPLLPRRRLRIPLLRGRSRPNRLKAQLPTRKLEPFHWPAIHMNLIANVIG